MCPGLVVGRMMETCRVEYCGRVANLDGLCLLHRRKELSGFLEYEDGQVYDTCAQRHRWTPENTYWDSSSKGGPRRRCRKCLAERARRKRSEEAPPEAPTPVALETPVQRKAHAVADAAQSGLDIKCRDDYARFTDYTAATMPSDIEAAKMCAGCPALQACANKAAAEGAAWGVWGGQVWLYGSPYNGDETRLDADD